MTEIFFSEFNRSPKKDRKLLLRQETLLEFSSESEVERPKKRSKKTLKFEVELSDDPVPYQKQMDWEKFGRALGYTSHVVHVR